MTTLTVRHITAPVTAEQIEDVRFRPVRMREGYDMGEVDSFLDTVIATLRGDTDRRHLTAADVNQMRFSPVRLREGYAMDEVDQLLDAIAQTLAAGHAHATAAPGAPDTSTTACGVCFAQVAAVDEDAHRSWHVSLLAGR